MNHEEQQKLADQVELEKLQKKIERMQQLVPVVGFFKCYFTMLKDYSTNFEAFHALNDEYFELFGVYRFSTWESFRNSMKHHDNKK